MDENIKQLLQKYRELIKSTAKLSDVTIGENIPSLKVASPTCVFKGNQSEIINVEVLLEGIAGAASSAEKEKTRIEKRRKELAVQMEQDEKTLSNPDFVAKASPDALKKRKTRYEECRVEDEKLAKRLEEMAGGSA